MCFPVDDTVTVLKTSASAEVMDIVYVNTVPYYGHSCKWVYGEKEQLQTDLASTLQHSKFW